jgi:AraC-like DNA-binding protein
LDAIFSFWYPIGMHAASESTFQKHFFSQLGNPIALARLFDWMPDTPFFAKDLKGRYVAANQASWRQKGLRGEIEMLGKTDFDFHPPMLATAYVAEDRRVLESRRPLPEQVWLVYDHLGNQGWFVSTKTPLFDRAGKPIGIAGAMRPIATAGALAESYQELRPAVEYAFERFSEKVEVRDLARLAGLSLSQFERRFKKLFGLTPSRHLLRIRVNAARTLLAQSGTALGEIALRCGFYDQSQFGRMFKRETGLTPRAYRSFHERRSNH